MELLKGYESEVKFVVPKSLTTATYKLFSHNIEIGSGNASVSDGIAKVDVGWNGVYQSGEIVITLAYTHNSTSYQPSKKVTVSTPILEMHEIAEILEDGNEKEYREVERAVRHIINAHCGQTFDYVVREYKTARGNGNYSLTLPARATKIYYIGAYVSEYVLKDDGWRLEGNVYDYEVGRYYMPHGVIRLPNGDNRIHFKNDVIVQILADWGWEEIPEPVREAARLLVNDYACGDALYRDRFVQSMLAADWRLQFNNGAFTDTGNVRANQLLEDYVVPGGWLAV